MVNKRWLAGILTAAMITGSMSPAEIVLAADNGKMAESVGQDSWSIEAETETETDQDKFVVDDDGVLTQYNGDDEEVTVPSDVKTIGENAFKGCTGILSITIPETVSKIDENAFKGCSSLQKITVLEKNLYYTSDDGVLYNKLQTKLVCYPAGKTETVYTVAKSVINIPSGVFAECENLAAFEVESGNLRYTAADGVLYNKTESTLLCYPAGKQDETFEISESVTTIEDYAFYNCSSLKNITVPDSVTTIGENAFANCGTEFTITCSEGSYAKTYAQEHNITVCSTGKSAQTITCGVGDSVDKLTEDDAFSLEASSSSGETLTYTSDNETVATVSAEGVVTLISAGTAHITIEAAETEKYQAAEPKTVTVTVKDKFEIAEDGTLIKYNGSENRVVIPDGVKSIGSNVFADMSDIYFVTIPDGVTSIQENAFGFCDGLQKIELPESVTTIGDRAFQYCLELRTAVIPDSVINFGTDVFKKCIVLTIQCEEGSAAEEYAKEQNIPYTVTPGTKKTQTITASDVTKTMGDEPFSLNAQTDGDGILSYVSQNTSVASVDQQGIVTLVGSGTAYILITASGTDAYRAAVKLVKVTVNEKTTLPDTPNTPDNSDKSDTSGSQGNSGTSGTTGTTGGTDTTGTKDNTDKTETTETVTPEDGTAVTSEGNRYQVTEQGKTVTYTGTEQGDSTVTIPETVTIGQVSYQVTAIAPNAFKNNQKIKKVVIGNNIKTIGNGAFYGCRKLVSVTIGKNVVSIGKNAFKNCTALKKIVIPNKVKTLGNGVFSGCKKLTSVTIGKSVISIGKEAFKGCPKLGTITVKTTKLKSVGKNAFKGIKSTAKVKVPLKKLKAYKTLFKGKGLSNKAKITKNS